MAGEKAQKAAKKFDWDSIPDEQLPGRSTKFDWDSIPDEKLGPSVGESYARGLKQGATFNFSDELGGRIQQGADAIAGMFGDSVTDTNAKLRAQGFTGDIGPTSSRELYVKARDEERALDQAAKAANSKAYVGGELSGALVTSFIPGMNAASGAKIGAHMGKAAMQGAISGAGNTENDVTSLEGIKDIGMSAGIGAAIPPAIRGAVLAGKGGIAAAKWVAQGVGKMGKKAFANASGMPVELVEHYMAHADDVNSAHTLEAIKDQADEFYSGREQMTNAAMSKADEAEKALSQAKNETRFRLQDEKYQAQLAKADAEKTASFLPMEIDEAVSDAVRDLRTNLSEKSAAAWDALPYGGSEKAIGKLKGSITAKINDLKVNGEVIGEKAKAAVDSLQRLRDQLDSLKSVSPREAKKIIKSLQNDVKASGGYNALMTDAATAEKKAIAAELNAGLKDEFPEYAAAMKPTAAAASLLEDLGKITDRESARRMVAQVFGKNGDIQIQKLKKLEEILGTPGRFSDRLRDASVKLQDAEGRLTKMADPEWAASQLAEIERGPIGKMAQFSKSVAEGQKEGLKAIDRISPNRSQPFIERVNPFRAKVNIEDQRFLDDLDEMTGKDFRGMIKNSAAKEAFEKGRINGSRNTLLWTVLGTAFGGFGGAGAGAVFGHAVDKYGPKMGKAVMDGMLKAQKMGKPFAQAIEELQVPDEIKNDFASKVYSIASRMSSIESGPVSRIAERSSEADRQPARSQSGWMKWMQSGVKKLGLDPATSQSLMTSKEGQRLLIEASDLPAGSKRLNEIKMKLQGQGK